MLELGRSVTEPVSFCGLPLAFVCVKFLSGSASEVRCSMFTVEQLESLTLVQVFLLMDYLFVREKDAL